MRQFLSEKMKKNEQLVMITSYEILLRDRSQLNVSMCKSGVCFCV